MNSKLSLAILVLVITGLLFSVTPIASGQTKTSDITSSKDVTTQ